ncbi:MAG: hypothetical protein COW30_14660 [Rhodospirillales bacterium CG15_BIG_FIL_POST_REV_8_21_14_020_66_15]|nr:MAG: hypothetical protein COW30_14660 [Rhodospirillales bacterium CG15_BIG_FIL_POST_REV_8_21_14_020_66_15]
MKTARKDMAEMATARADVYGLLAEVFRAEPSESFLSCLQGPEFSQALTALGSSPEAIFGDLADRQLAEELALDFTRLFVGPGPRLSPHESLHVETPCGGNDFWGVETVEVKKFMEGAGLTLDDSFTGMPDHISAELEFMQRLAIQEAAYWTDGDKESARGAMAVQRRFLDEHLSRWLPRFCDKVAARAEQPFFREMAKLTKAFVGFERDTLCAAG